MLNFCTLFAAIAVVAAYDEITSPNDHVTYRLGDSSLIISVPHGGYLKPGNIPDRHHGCYVNSECVYAQNCGTPDSSNCKVGLLRDSYTKEIAETVWDYIFDETGSKPHMIINELYRAKLDANREVNEATFGDATATTAFNYYHQFIEDARAYIAENTTNGRGLFVDFHGQTHSENWVELGYRLSKSNLNDGVIPAAKCSLRQLQETECGTTNLTCDYEIIRGTPSLGALLAAKNYDVIPSPDFLSPGSGNYYTGGYNTKTYGSALLDGETDSVQCEIPKPIRFSSTDRVTFANDLGQSLVEFMDLHDYEY